MDHSSGNSSSTSSSMSHPKMRMYLHFNGGDMLIFKSLAPTSDGAKAGAAIFLFFFAVLDRYVAAMRAVMEAHWKKRARALVESQAALGVDRSNDVKTSNASLPSPSTSRQRVIPPFIWSHDVSRGAMQALQAFFHFSLMLAVMTYNGAYIITIIAGLGVGEAVFGRLFASHFSAQHH